MLASLSSDTEPLVWGFLPGSLQALLELSTLWLQCLYPLHGEASVSPFLDTCNYAGLCVTCSGCCDYYFMTEDKSHWGLEQEDQGWLHSRSQAWAGISKSLPCMPNTFLGADPIPAPCPQNKPDEYFIIINRRFVLACPSSVTLIFKLKIR